ncbi:MAG: hypothetical protein K2K58_11510, partial [Muribaculaceae bacterium]|nr:hypothetical protein [Muribaculaceae bacterium]
DWDPLQLVYDLHGPYFLHIEETTVNVEPGEIYKMWYETNATELIGHSPMVEVNGKKIPLFKFDTVGGTFNIRINTEVPSSLFPDIKAHSSQYSFFHIQAGNIYKKIEVYPFDLDLFLTVSPDDITINVRDEISSLKYNGVYEISINTNYDYLTITPTNWNELFTDNTTTTNTCTFLYLEDSNGKKITFGTPFEADKTGKTKYYLKYNGLNDGIDFWTKDSHKLKLSVTGTTKPDNNNQVQTSDPEVVKINTYPSSDDYIIHVKLPSNWDSPHIYVYQCLEFPATTNNSLRANQPLATNGNGTTAALEYSFTGKIAFRGWNVGTYNDPNADAAKLTNGFWYFKDDNTWDPADANTKHYYQLDFCKDFRDIVSQPSECPKCGYNEYNHREGDVHKEGYNRLWPGIRMKWEKDVDGGKWWKFKLTGVATPGKALIMWSNSHDGNNDNNFRYPNYQPGNSNPDPGIPLFDYPNREGWIDLTSDEGKQAGFSPIDPNETPDDSNIPTYRLYFKWNAHGKLKGLNIWGTSFAVGDSEFDYNNKTEEKAKKGTDAGDAYYYKDSNGWAYLEWKTKNMPSGKMSLALPNSGDEWTTFSKSVFIKVGNVRCAYSDPSDSNKIKAGKPSDAN